MNEITIRHKLKQGHKMFTDKETAYLLAEITQLRDQLKAAKAAAQQVPMFDPALPLDKGAKQVADDLLKEAKDIFDGELSLCDDVNTPGWMWKWKVRYYFEDTDITVSYLAG